MATKETVLLYYNLKNLPGDSVIFGHHHSTASGVMWRGDSNRSDVKDVTGSFPGVYGWDFADITNGDDTLMQKRFKQLTTEAYSRGGINIFAWHYYNPVTKGTWSFYDTTVAVRHILPGGSANDVYKSDLKKIAGFTNSLIGKDEELIPVIFRPFHEFDGSWFWWGKHFCTREEFISLWQFTVGYLRDSMMVRNMLYGFSPDRNFDTDSLFLDRYPGDEYVDLIGMDDYWDFTEMGEGLEEVTRKLQLVTKLAERKGKISAFTETGLETIPDSNWWTGKLLPAIMNDSIKIAFVMVWRNDRESHHYAPYPGHKSAPDFIKFKNDPRVLFEDELPNVYILPD
jgi:mannan endo-1,4-beta-mannosidase